MSAQHPAYVTPKGTVPPVPAGTSVAVVGLGRVGLPLALSFASKGLRVIGVERDARVRGLLAEKRMPFHEPGCEELLARHPMEIIADVGELTKEQAPDFVVITVGTPLQAHIECDL